jgi:hypothetical protein
MAAAGGHLALESFEIPVQVGQRMLLELARRVAQGLELRQGGDSFGATVDEPAPGTAEGGSEIVVREGRAGLLAVAGGRVLDQRSSPLAGDSPIAGSAP